MELLIGVIVSFALGYGFRSAMSRHRRWPRGYRALGPANRVRNSRG